MPSYLRPDNLQAYQTPLYQPNFNLLGQVNQTNQLKYDRGVEAIRSTHADVMGLNPDSQYNSTKLQSYIANADNELKKSATLNFSKADDVAKAENIFAPIYQDKDLMYEVGNIRSNDKEQQVGLGYRSSTKAEDRDAYSDTNLQYIMNPREQLRNASTKEDMIKYATIAGQRKYLPYQNTVKKLDKLAEDGKLDYTVDQINGAYIIKSKFGGQAIASLQDFASMGLDSNDLKQLEINGTVMIEGFRKQGKTDTEIGDQLYGKYIEEAKNDFDNTKTTLNVVENRIKDLTKGDRGTLTQSEVNELSHNKELLKNLQEKRDFQEKRYKEYSNKTGEAAKLYNDYLTNPEQMVANVARIGLINNWATKYANTHLSNTTDKNEVALKMMDYQHDFDMEDYKAKLKLSEKAPKTEKETAEDKLNSPTVIDDNIENNVVTNTYKALQDNKAIHQQEINRIVNQGIVFNYANESLGLSEGMINTLGKDREKDRKLTDDEKKELSSTTLYKDLDLSKETSKSMYTKIRQNAINDGLSNAKDNTEKGGQFLMASMEYQMHKQSLELVGKMENDPKSPLYGMSQLKELIKADGTMVSETEFMDSEMTKLGYKGQGILNVYQKKTNKHRIYKTDYLNYPFQSAGNDIYNSGASMANIERAPKDVVDGLKKKYNDSKEKFQTYNDLLKKDPEINKYLVSQNYPGLFYPSDGKIETNEISDIVYKSLITKNNINSTKIQNWQQIKDALKEKGQGNVSDEKITEELLKLQGDVTFNRGIRMYPNNGQGDVKYDVLFNTDKLKFTDDSKHDKLEVAIKQVLATQGLTIKNNTPIIGGPDSRRANQLERLLQANGKFEYNLGTVGDPSFGFKIFKTKEYGTGNPVIRYTLTGKDVERDANGEIMYNTDGTYSVKSTSRTAQLDNVTPDEAYKALTSTLYQMYMQHTKVLRSRK